MHRILIAACAALLISAAGCGDARKATGSASDCSACHAFPPATLTAGGPHPQPAAGEWAATDCAVCHLTSVDATTGEVLPLPGGTHADGKVDGGHTLPYPASLHGPAANAGLAACASCHGPNLDGGTVNQSCDECHAGGTAWRTDCTFCHGDPARAATPDALSKSAPPADVAGSLDTVDVGVGAHERHVVDFAVACTVCHPAVPTDVLSAGHVDGGPAEITFGGLAVTGSLAPAWDRTAATCATTYCHGGGFTDGGGANTAPVWTSVGTGQADCGDCHALPVPAASHPQPWSPATWTAVDCNLCHGASVDGTGQLLAAHLDGTTASAPDCTTCHDLTVAPRSWLHTRSSASATAPLACSVCHTGWVPAGHPSDGDTKTSTVTCASCHGDATATPAPTAAAPRAAAPPVDVHGGTDAAKVGRHAVHLDGGLYANGFACASCHADVGTYTKAHADGAADVGFSGAIGGTGAYAAGTCSSTYCHGNFAGGLAASPTWTGAATCGTCHGTPPTSGRHQVPDHLSTGCTLCHGTGYSLTAVNKALHVDGAKDVSAAAIVGWNGTTSTCTSACHVPNDVRTWYP